MARNDRLDTNTRPYLNEMSPFNTDQSPREVLTSIIKNVSSIDASNTTVPEQNISTDQDLSFSTLVAKLERNHQDQVKNVLLTLHFLFPHELLPALDLLDRKLITCLHLNVSMSENMSSMTAPSAERMEDTEATRPFKFYYVQSASAAAQNSSTSGASSSTSRFRNVYSTVGTYYEVHLDSWNCSCPAFAFSSMKLLMSATESRVYLSGKEKRQSEQKRGDAGTSSEHIIGDAMEGLDVNWDARTKNEGESWQFGGSVVNENSVVPICKHILAVVLANGVPSLFVNAIQSAEASREEIAGRAAGFGTK